MDKKATVLKLGLLAAALVLVVVVAVPVYAVAPLFGNQSVQIAENSPNGAFTTPKFLNATDPQGSPITFDLLNGDAEGVFEVEASTGAVSVVNTAALNYESKTSFSMVVRATNNLQEAKEATVTINIVDQADEPPVMNDQNFSVNENSANGFVVGKIAFTDADVNDSHTFTINTGNGGAFAIANNGNISVNNSSLLNYESTTQFVLNVTVKDKGDNQATADITINVADMNEKPNVNDTPFTISEQATNGTDVGTVVATDPDAGDTLTFARTSGSTAFAIGESSGKVTVVDSSQLNFEANPALTFVVTVSDSKGLTDTATITVNLTDENDPPRVTGSGIPDVIINEGTASATRNLWAAFEDDEDADNELTFVIFSNTNPGLFSVPPVPNNTTGVLTLNFANGATGTGEITVRAFDTDGAFVPDTFKIDFNEAPEALGFSNVTVQEDAPDTIINLTTGFTDAEQPSSELVYAIIGNTNGGLFTSATINANDELVLDYAPDANGQAILTIRATDIGGLTAQATITVKVNPVNDKPTTSGIPNVIVQEDAGNTVIELFKHFDDKEDDPKQLTYALISNSNPNLFDDVNLNQGTATLTLDYKANTSGTSTLVVRATDKGTPGQGDESKQSVESTFTVTVGATNDKPILTGDITKEVTEDIPLSFKLSDFVAKFSDDDNDPLSSVRIQSLPANGTLKLSGVNVTLNQVIPAAQLDNLSFVPDQNWDSGSTSFEWNASDGASYADTPANVIITVKAVNDAPTVSNIEKSGPEGVNIIFAKQDFTLAFADVDGQTLQTVKIVTVPEHGTLKRGNETVSANDQINVDLLDQLRYVPDQFFNGVDSFNWTGSDGTLYATPAKVTLTIEPMNNAPTIDLNGNGPGVNFNATFAAGGPGVSITGQNLTITDVDDDMMDSATVIIVGLKNGAKEILSADKAGTTIDIAYSISGSNGLLQLKGPASIADFEKVLKTVKYRIEPDVTNPDLSQRTVQFIVYDGEANSNDAFAKVNIINPRIEITITPDIQAVAKGGSAIFTVHIKNVGSVGLKNISVISAAVPACSRPDLGTLAPGATLEPYVCLVSEVEGRIDNEVVVSAVDVEVGSKVTDDDEAIVRVLREMAVSISPAPSVGDVLVKGQDAEFIVTVVNPSEVKLTDVQVKAYIDYDLALALASTDEKVPAPTCDKVIGDMAAGKESQYTCKIPNVQSSFQIEVDATGLVEGLTPTGDFDIEQISVLDLSLDVSAAPFEIPSGTPTPVEFSLTLANISNVPLTLTTLVSNIHGNLLNPANTTVTENTCPGIALAIPEGEVRTCLYKVVINAEPSAITNVITALATDVGGKLVNVEDTAIVSVGDFTSLEVSLTANPISIIAPVGTVNITVRVQNNTSSQITLDDLREAGSSLNGRGNCTVPTDIPANNEYSCVYSVTINNLKPGDVVTRTVVAIAGSQEESASINIPVTSSSQVSLLLPLIGADLFGEPNNSVCAYHSIETNTNYSYYANDTNDWYRFELNSKSDVKIRLSNFLVSEGQVIVWQGNNDCVLDDDDGPLGHNGERGVTPVREITLNDLGENGVTSYYYVWVLSSAGLTSAAPYNLIVTTTAP